MIQKLTATNTLIASYLLAQLFSPSIAATQTFPTSLGWTQLNNTKIRSVCPDPAQYPTIQGAEGCEAVVTNWNSAAFDTKRNRLILWGGGHNGYYGNELYALDLADITMKRITNPGIPSAPYTPCQESIANGSQPNSRHTYDALAYIEHADRFMSASGGLACAYSTPSSEIWTFSFTSGTWQRMSPSGDSLLMGWDPNTIEGTAISYDPVSKFVFIDNRVGLLTYNFTTNSLKIRNNRGGHYRTFGVTTIIDPGRRFLYAIGGGQMWRWDISSIGEGNTTGTIPDPVSISSSGGSAIVNANHPGLAWDSASQRVVAWSGGNTVYTLDGATNTWTAHTSSGGPGSPDGNGTFKRWAYSPTSQAFVVVNSIDRDAFAFRLAAQSVDTSAPTVPSNVVATATSASQINLTWNASTDNQGVTGYRVYRNGTQIHTATNLQYSDTGLSPSTTYAYTLAAIDAAGNVSSQSIGASATTFAQSSGGSDFQSRCNAPGVLTCNGFDNTTTDIVPNINLFSGDGGYMGGSLDSTVKASGGGALKFTLPAGRGTSDIAGSWTGSLGAAFGENSTFYVQFQQRFSPEMISNIPTWQTGVNTSWKTVLFHRTGSTCGQIEITTNFYQYSSKPALQMYTGCGSSPFYTNESRTAMSSSGPLIQQGTSNSSGYNCSYTNVVTGTGNGTGCFIVPSNKWITFYYKIHIGTYGTTNSSVEAWIAVDGAPYTQFINVKNAVLQKDGPPPGDKYNAITLTPYMTSLRTAASETAYTWYDELIVSTQPIAPPGGSASSNPPPAAPTNLRIQ